MVLACFLLTQLAASRSVEAAQCPVPPEEVTSGAIDGRHAILAAHDTFDLPIVHFHEKTALGWQLGQQFVVGDLTVFRRVQVAIEGNRAIAGCSEATGVDSISGRAFVFERALGQWVATELFSASVGLATFFGTAVDIDGDVAIVSASRDEIAGGDGLVRVHVFEFDGTVWAETAQLPGYVSPIAVEDGTIAVSDQTFVDVYRKVSGVWTLTDRLRANGMPGNARFGTSLALSEQRLAVGTVSHREPAIVEVYERQGNAFVPAQRIVAHDGGYELSVALEGSTLLVGSPAHDVIRRFEHDGTSFVETSSLAPPTPIAGFGHRVHFSGQDAIVWDHSDNGYLYRLGFANVAAFCPTTSNSTGFAATLAVEGCDSRAGERMTLVASALPPGVLGQFLIGSSTTQVPFGDGFLCLESPFFRSSAAVSDAAGHLVHELDFSGRPAAGFAAGDTWHFQASYRDPASSGAGANFSNALSVRITP